MLVLLNTTFLVVWKLQNLTLLNSKQLLDVIDASTSNSPQDHHIVHSTICPTFGKITASFGDLDPTYEAAIASHTLHNRFYGYPHFVLREQVMSGLWSKHAWMMTIIGQELSKPKEQRLQWLMWHDRDTILMNPQIPLEIFTPPEPKFSHIHLMVTNDRNGLNNGVFMIRVNQWAFKLFASALSIREYQPEIPLKYTEQSGLEETIKRVSSALFPTYAPIITKQPWWASGVAYVPQNWFNGFPPDRNATDDNSRMHARKGSLLIHFASNRDGKRPERMAYWGSVVSDGTSDWNKPVEKTWYQEEIAEYWRRVGDGEEYGKINKDIGRRTWRISKEGVNQTGM